MKPRFLWWRFAAMALTLLVLGWGFNAAWFCEPAPTQSQQAIFSLALIMTLMQTVQAGWLRHDDPWEMRAFRYVAVFFVALAVLAVIVSMVLGLLFILSLIDDPALQIMVLLAVLIFTALMYRIVRKDGA